MAWRAESERAEQNAMIDCYITYRISLRRVNPGLNLVSESEPARFKVEHK